MKAPPIADLTEASVRDFERAPIGRYTCTGSCVVWCASPSLTGWHIWGRPDEDETRAILRLLAQYPKMASTFDVITDSRGVEVINPPALAILVPWIVEHRVTLERRVRRQANVIRRDPVGFLLMGILASLGDSRPQQTFAEPFEAFRAIAGDAGTKLCAQIEDVVEKVREVPRELAAVRAQLATSLESTIDDAAKTLSTSSRSLQRVLQHHGTSFHDEQTDARFASAKRLLGASDEKIASVARRVGWSERTLTTIFRDRTGLTPTDWRKRPTTD